MLSFRLTLLFLCASISHVLDAQQLRQPFHLTARPWQALNISPERYLDVLEGVARFSTSHQNAEGAIIDPFLKREHQYATPYFAYAVGTLVSEGHAKDLLPNGIRAMEHATECFGGGKESIPDQHGEFFIAVLTGALPLYAPHIPAEQLARWRERLKRPLGEVIKGVLNNWETYAMKGEWMRSRAGLVSRDAAIASIERAWDARQKQRIAAPPWFLYHDRTSDPDTLSVEAVGRGNLLALTHLGYDGPSAAAIRTAVEAATKNTLLLQDPTGQTPANGRTDSHVWVDIGYQLAYEVMAERALAAGDRELAGQFRRAAMLTFQNAQRWRREDGSFFVTKNRFDPKLRVGYQLASEYSNYNGSLMFHLAEAFHARRSGIAERPAPAEIGGYAFRLDEEFATAFANAGGMQMQANLRGQTTETHGNRWTPLGVVRFARPGWETRLGPSDGALTATGGVTFAPAFAENGRWLRMGDLSSRYEAEWSTTLVHPLLVRASLLYKPKRDASGPSFRNDFVLTPDGILSIAERTSGETGEWGMTWPLLENDGKPLEWQTTANLASVRYPQGGDEQNFFALGDGVRVTAEERPVRGSYGDLRPVRAVTAAREHRTFIYPRTASDPSAADVRKSFRFTSTGFTSALGRVDGDLYVGRTSAGGVGDALDVDGDGKPEITLSARCAFVAELREGAIVALETDRDVEATMGSIRRTLRAFVPARFSASNGR